MVKPEEVKINFYNVNKCGYYSFGDPNPKFGNLGELLADLKKWGSGVEISLTKLFNPPADGKDGAYPIYLFGIESNGDDWVFATWNEVPSTEGTVASVNMHDQVGAAHVNENGIKEDSIPGYATYFWALPKQNLIATIRFQHVMNGQAMMQQYLESFLETSARYVVVDKSDPLLRTIVGYSDAQDGALKKVQPKFKTFAYNKPGDIDYIYEQHASIRKVVRRGHLTTTNEVDRDIWQNVIRFLRGSKDAAKKAFVNQNTYVELEYTPTLAELKKMVQAEMDDYTTSNWDDLGFVLKGEASKIYWVGRSAASGEITLDLKRTNNEAVDLNSILSALEKHRTQIMKILD